MPRNSLQRKPPPFWAYGGHLELEIKLLGTAQSLDQVRESALFRALAARPPSIHHLHNIYYDTPARWFAAQALTLRVRTDGDRHTQSLKSRIEARNGMFQRWELEHEVSSTVPDMALLRGVLAGFAPAELFADIVPAFETRFTRTQWEIEAPCERSDEVGRIAVAFDLGAIAAGAHLEPIAEIELELISGPESALRALAARLVDLHPLKYGRSSKAQRGYRLADRVLCPVDADQRPDN